MSDALSSRAPHDLPGGAFSHRVERSELPLALVRAVQQRNRHFLARLVGGQLPRKALAHALQRDFDVGHRSRIKILCNHFVSASSNVCCPDLFLAQGLIAATT